MLLLTNEKNKQELANALSLETVSGYMNRTISKLIAQKLIDRTIPDNPNHAAQRFKINRAGQNIFGVIGTLKKKILLLLYGNRTGKVESRKAQQNRLLKMISFFVFQFLANFWRDDSK